MAAPRIELGLHPCQGCVLTTGLCGLNHNTKLRFKKPSY